MRAMQDQMSALHLVMEQSTSEHQSKVCVVCVMCEGVWCRGYVVTPLVAIVTATGTREATSDNGT